MTTTISTIDKLDAAAGAVRDRTEVVPALGIVAGSGLSSLGGLIDDATRIPYDDIPHMHKTTVTGHAGELVIGTLEGLPVAVLSGRIHGYEGHTPAELVFGVRLLGRIGTPRVLLTNAAGGVHRFMNPGTLCRIVDHLNLTGQNPLSGPNVAELGTRFPDLTYAYAPDFGEDIDAAARAAGVTLHRGVYACFSGPSYETPAEVRMARILGADLVGMSTVLECIALNHMGVKVGGISCVTNHAAGVSPVPLDHGEVKEVANLAGPRLLSIVRALAGRLAGAEEAA